jgi:hypothetical protein
MPLILDITLPNGEDAPVYANHIMTLTAAIEIVDGELKKKGAWASMVKAHITKKEYKWELHFSDGNAPEWVTLPKGSRINMYRGSW